LLVIFNAFALLVSPLLALVLGHVINHEPLTISAVTGTLFILAALIMYEFFDRLPALKPKGK
jgi:drug/metabolite transporter (DMT)-like permease